MALNHLKMQCQIKNQLRQGLRFGSNLNNNLSRCSQRILRKDAPGGARDRRSSSCILRGDSLCDDNRLMLTSPSSTTATSACTFNKNMSATLMARFVATAAEI